MEEIGIGEGFSDYKKKWYMCFRLHSLFGFLLWVPDAIQTQLICTWGTDSSYKLSKKKKFGWCDGHEIRHTLLKNFLEYTLMKMENITSTTTCSSLCITWLIEIDRREPSFSLLLKQNALSPSRYDDHKVNVSLARL